MNIHGRLFRLAAKMAVRWGHEQASALVYEDISVRISARIARLPYLVIFDREDHVSHGIYTAFDQSLQTLVGPADESGRLIGIGGAASERLTQHLYLQFLIANGYMTHTLSLLQADLGGVSEEDAKNSIVDRLAPNTPIRDLAEVFAASK